MNEIQKLRAEQLRHLSDTEKFLSAWEGFLVRKLPPDQLKYFRILERMGRARRSYEGLAGLVGYARVRRA